MQAESGGFGEAESGGFGEAESGGFGEAESGGFDEAESRGLGERLPLPYRSNASSISSDNPSRKGIRAAQPSD
jgi:hypothetical protein